MKFQRRLSIGSAALSMLLVFVMHDAYAQRGNAPPDTLDVVRANLAELVVDGFGFDDSDWVGVSIWVAPKKAQRLQARGGTTTCNWIDFPAVRVGRGKFRLRFDVAQVRDALFPGSTESALQRWQSLMNYGYSYVIRLYDDRSEDEDMYPTCWMRKNSYVLLNPIGKYVWGDVRGNQGTVD